MAIGFEQAHDALLVCGRQLGEHIGGFHCNRQFSIAHALNVIAQQQALLVQPHFPADFRRHQLVITGQHFDRHAVLSQGFKRRRRALLGRIKECHVANQGQLLLIRQGISVAPRLH